MVHIDLSHILSVRECFATFSYHFCGLLIAIVYASPLMANNIDFEDPVVKKMCVENWDSDNDGEISQQEAAAVETLGSVFRNNKSMGAFTELKYFTGLSALDEYAFAESSISKVVIPGNVKSIGRYAFYHCFNLTSAIVCEGVETIGCFAFSAPLSLLSLPSSITYLDHQFVDPFVGNNSTSSGGMSFPDGVFYLYAHSNEPATCHSNAFYRLFGVSYLVVPIGSKSAYQSAVGWKQFFKTLEYADVAIGNTGYATLYYATKALTVPEKVEAYVVTQTDIDGSFSGWTATYASGSIIPAGEPVVLKGEQGDYDFEEASSSSAVAVEGNLLRGCDVAAMTTAPAEGDYHFYMLSTDANGENVGFYYGNDDGSAFECQEHKAYLALPAAASTRCYPFSAAQGTGVGIVNYQLSMSNYFDLSGRKISGKPLKKGVYVRNGRKEVVK